LKKHFTENLLKWNSTENDRKLPWKGIKNPYFIWLSEIILQQTRAEQGLPYYLKFIENFPEVADLAAADEDKVMKLWQGLGYYSRARNLHSAAKCIIDVYEGKFPSKYEDILSLKGVGPYTAAAIASFAFGLPYAVVDGNVYRVLSRYFGIADPIDSTIGKKKFSTLAQELIDKKRPAQYNQAIMDFGAKLCAPANPACMFCPMSANCVAFQTGQIKNLPVKQKKIKKRERFFYYLILNKKQEILIKKRTEKGIWRNLYDFPLIETEKEVDDAELNKLILLNFGIDDSVEKKASKTYIHILTHQKIYVKFIKIDLKKKLKNDEFIGVSSKKLIEYAFPKVIDKFLEENSYYAKK